MDDKDWIEKFNREKKQKEQAAKDKKEADANAPRVNPNNMTSEDWSANRLKSRQAYLERQATLKMAEAKRLGAEHEATLTHKAHMLSEAQVTRTEATLDTLRKVQEFESTLQKVDDAPMAYHIPNAQQQSTLDKRARDNDELHALMMSNRPGGMNENGGARTALEEQRNVEKTKFEQSGAKASKKARTADWDILNMLAIDQVHFLSESILSGEGAMPQYMSDEDVVRMRAEEAARARMTVEALRKGLPIYQRRDEILQTVREKDVMVLVGDTGSGKSTQLPQYLREAGYTSAKTTHPKEEILRIVCTQPRRVAAMSVASRVAYEVGCKVGNEVGYKVRFEDETSRRTEIVYMTDGMLLREYLTDPNLTSFSCVIIDEAHERALHTDVLLGLVRETFRARRDTDNVLKVIIASATLQAEKFSRYFDNAPILRVKGRMYPVEVFHTQQVQQDYIEAAVACVVQIHVREKPGDVLVFLTGQDEIEDCHELLKQRLASIRHLGIREALVFPIYSTLPADQQRRIFEPTPEGARKIVIATNIAETSLTIDGIVYVVDCGFCKQNWYDPKTDMSSLVITPISRAGAEQRQGRAGRTQPGKCFRLYTKAAFHENLTDSVVPEIQRTNIANVVLEVKALGVDNFLEFEFLDPPSQEYVQQAFNVLFSLQAINAKGELTKTGRRMAEFPLDPKLSKCLVKAEDYGCTSQVAMIAAMLSVNSGIFYTPRDPNQRRLAEAAKRSFNSGYGDHISLMEIFEQWQDSKFDEMWCTTHFVQQRTLRSAFRIREQLLSLLDRVDISPTLRSDSMANVLKAILSGFFCNVAKVNQFGTSFLRMGRHKCECTPHPSSSLAKRDPLPPCVMFDHIRQTSKDFMVHVSVIETAWLAEVAPHVFKASEKEKRKKK